MSFMTGRLLPILLTVFSLVIGVVAVPPMGMAMETDDTLPLLTASATESNQNTTQSNQTLLSRDELFASVDDKNGRNTTAKLYFVAVNGTWFHALPDGTIGAPAPHGNVIPNVDTEIGNGTTVNETLEIDEENLPVYVWKVTQPCETAAYNASSSDLIADFDIPGCSGLRAPSEPPTENQTTPSPSPRETHTETTGGTGAGFDTITAIIGFCVVVFFIREQH